MYGFHPARRIAIVLLALGTVGGFGLGFASMRCHGRERRAAFEEHVAKVCVDAARSDRGERSDRGPDHGRFGDDDEAR